MLDIRPKTSLLLKRADGMTAPAGVINSALRCRTVTSDADFANLETVWLSLSSECVSPSPFRSWGWVSAWWRYFGGRQGGDGKSRKLYVVVVETEGGAAAGILPLHYNCVAPLSLKPCRLELIGQCGLEQTLNEEPAMLLRAGYERRALHAALAHLYSHECKVRWDFLAFDVVCPPAERLLNGPPSSDIQRQSPVWEQGEYAGAMILEPGKDWEAYRRSLSKSMRDNTAYYPKRLAKHGRTMQVRIINQADQLAAAVDIVIDMHHRRAQDTHSAAHVNHIDGPVQRAMLQYVLQKFAQENCAFVAILEIDGTVAAAQAFLRQGDTIVFYYSGHEPSFAEYSPLTLLSMDVIRHGMDKGSARLNFLTGKMLWKERWAAQPESVVQTLFCASGTTRAKLFAFSRQLLHACRALRKRAGRQALER